MRTTADLREYLEAIDLCYFAGELDCSIGWMRPHKAFTRVAQYDFERCRIEVSRTLAYLWVPTVYVLQTVHHEAIHAELGPEHNEWFRARERLFAHTYDAFLWERENAPKLRDALCPKGLR